MNIPKRSGTTAAVVILILLGLVFSPNTIVGNVTESPEHQPVDSLCNFGMETEKTTHNVEVEFRGSSRPPIMQWNRTFGGAADDWAYSVVQTRDGGYIVAGETESFGAGLADMWLVKTNASGNMQWSKTFGGAADDWAYSVVQTRDGGYIVAGGTESFGAGGGDMWWVKTGSSGNMQWSKTYGNTDPDYKKFFFETATSVQQTSDGGYIIAGYNSSGSEFCRMLLVKTDASGNMQWSKTYRFTDSMIELNDAWCVQQTSDLGYIVTGSIISNEFSDMLLVKTDASGNMQWSKTFGVADWFDDAYSVVQTRDGGYIVAGIGEMLLVKTDASGNMQWSKTFGEAYCWPYSVVQTSDGGYIVAGGTGDSNLGLADMWLVKTDASGNMQWSKTFGGAANDWANSVVQTKDGGYIVAGETESFGAGGGDMWLVKVGEPIEISAPKKLEFNYWRARFNRTEEEFRIPVGFIRIRSIGYSGKVTVWGFVDVEWGKYLYVAENPRQEEASLGPLELPSKRDLQPGEFVDVFIFYGYHSKSPAPEESPYEITVETEDGTTYKAEIVIRRTGMALCGNGSYVYTGGTATFSWNVEGGSWAFLESELELPQGWSYSLDPPNGTVFETPRTIRVSIKAASEAKEGDIGIVTLRAFSNETKLMFWQFIYFAAVDSTPPTIETVHTPISSSDGLTIGYTIEDITTGIESAQLFYSVDEGPWNNETMEWQSGDTFNSTTFTLTIPPIAKNSTLRYYVVAVDWLDNQVVSEVQTYKYTRLVADINGDGVVDIRDITIVAVAFQTKSGDPNWNEIADLDKNGTIDIIDITMVAVDFGKTT